MQPQPHWNSAGRTQSADLRLVTEPPDRYDRDLIAEFLAQADVGDATRSKYRAHLDEYVTWLNHPNIRGGRERVELPDAEPSDVQRYLSYLAGDRFAARVLPRATRPMGASARKSTLGSLRAFYRYLILMRISSSDPTLHVKAPRVRHHPGLVLDADELHKLLAEVGTPRDRIQTYLLLYTAARSNEIRQLRWSDVDLRQGTMLLHGKNDIHRMIDIHPVLMAELRRWMIFQQDDLASRPVAAQVAASNDLVLVSRTGRQLAKTVLGRQLKQRAIRAGVRLVENADGEITSKVSPHALRRTFATILLISGEPLDAVADVLGHRFTDTTRTHYAFTSSARRRATIHSFSF